MIKESDTKNKNMKIVGTYIENDIYDELQKEADESFTSVSSIVRKIIYKYVNSKNELN